MKHGATRDPTSNEEVVRRTICCLLRTYVRVLLCIYSVHTLCLCLCVESKHLQQQLSFQVEKEVNHCMHAVWRFYFNQHTNIKHTRQDYRRRHVLHSGGGAVAIHIPF